MREIHCEPLKSGGFRARVTDPSTGRRISITDSTEETVRQRVRQARQIAADVRSGIVEPRELQQRFMRATFGAPTVEALWKAYHATLRGQWRAKAEEIFRRQLARLAQRRAWELRPEVLAEWERDEAKAGRAKATIWLAFTVLRAIYKAAMGDAIQAIPWRKWRPQAPPKGEETREACRNIQELEALVRAAIEVDARAVAAGRFGDLAVRILVLALTGLRQGEAVALAWEDLDLDGEQPTLTVRHSAHLRWYQKGTRPLDPPKANRVRTQVLHEHAASALRVQRERLKVRGLYRIDGPVFPAVDGFDMGWRRVVQVIDARQLREVVKAAGLPNVRAWVPHSLRHTFATLETVAAWATTGDVKAAMGRTGHTRVETLVGYLHRGNRGRPASFIGQLGESVAVLALPPASVAVSPAAASTKAAIGALAASVSGCVEGEPENLAALAERWPTGLPKRVADMAGARYRKAYSRAQRQGSGPEACRQRGAASRKAFLMAWARAQSDVRRRRSAALSEPAAAQEGVTATEADEGAGVVE